MRFGLLLYPEAIKRIEESGLASRFKKLQKSEDSVSLIYGYLGKEDIVNIFADLKERGYFKHFPKDCAKSALDTSNLILNNPEEVKWTTQRPSGEVSEPCVLEDLLLSSGEVASLLLSPEEIWDFKKFGFSSPLEFVETLGAYMMQIERSYLEKGYSWVSKREGGSEIQSEITGDSNCDLRIIQKDITPYPTKDPFGNEIHMRPEFKTDKKYVSPYHSTEGVLFIGVMKYIEQVGVKAQYLQDKGAELTKWGKSLGRRGGTCTEHFCDDGENPMVMFSCFDRECALPKLDENNESKFFSSFNLWCSHDYTYGIYEGNNGNLVITSNDRNEPEKLKRREVMDFLPEDAEEMIKGLIYQSAMGLGRTSPNQLLRLLNYRFSDEYVEDKKRHEEFAKAMKK